MTNTKHTRGPWVWDKFADGYALVSESEMSYGTTRKAIDLSYEGPNRDILAAAPAMLEALRLARSALNTAPRFRVSDTDSYKIAAIVDEAIEAATARRHQSERNHFMERTQIEMSEDEFDDKYPLVVNHLNPNASWCVGDGPGCLFETYGEELEFVRQQDPCTVWTLVDGDDGDQYLTNGFHFVNRIGYLVSTVPVPEEIDIEVRIAMQEAPTPEPDMRAERLGQARRTPDLRRL